MARLFCDTSSSSSSDLPTAAAAVTTTASSSAPPLPSPFPDLGVPLSAADLRTTAYEILVAASRATGAKPLTYIPQSNTTRSTSTSLQCSLTSTAASKVKRGWRAAPRGRPATVAELVRNRLGVTERADARIRRGLLRIAAGQVVISVP